MDDFTLSPLHLFLQAGPVGKSVMALLLAASIWCWLLIAESLFGVVRLARALKAAKAGAPAPLLAGFDAAGPQEARIRVRGETVSERRQRVAEKMTRSGLDLLTSAEGGLANLAVISSVAPFVGLFGTVWGIMASFVGIAAAKDTSLAVVAPGIAEALAATAYGLAAAIPASIGYNRLGARFFAARPEMLVIWPPTAPPNLPARSRIGGASGGGVMAFSAPGSATARLSPPAGRHQCDAAGRRHAGAADHLHGHGAAARRRHEGRSAAGQGGAAAQSQGADRRGRRQGWQAGARRRTVDPADLVQLVHAKMGDDPTPRRAFARRQGSRLWPDGRGAGRTGDATGSPISPSSPTPARAEAGEPARSSATIAAQG